MKEQMPDLDQLHEKVKQLRTELESQLNLLNSYVSDTEISEASDYYYQSREKFVDLSKLKFGFKKYFIDTISSSFSRKSSLDKNSLLQIETIINNFFNDQDYVLVLSNSSNYYENILRQLYSRFKKEKAGKIIIDDKNSDEETIESGTKETISDTKVRLPIKLVKNDVCVYEGYDLANANVLLIGEAFGAINCVTTLITEAKPKAVLNLMISSGNTSFWLDNVD